MNIDIQAMMKRSRQLKLLEKKTRRLKGFPG
jgi:hypothetical protein